jgi:GNAT superfamily N-acetyltransferase
MQILPLDPLPIDTLKPLVDEGTREGFRFPRRLVDEHVSGAVRFDVAGEVLLGVFEGDALVAVGGVTRDPYGDSDETGRIRHVYVRATHRGRGIGAMLMRALEAHARRHFSALTLRTDTEAAARFYAALGYRTLAAGGTATHRRELGPVGDHHLPGAR